MYVCMHVHVCMYIVYVLTGQWSYIPLEMSAKYAIEENREFIYFVAL